MTEQVSIEHNDTDYMTALDNMTHAGFFPRFISYIIDIVVLWGVAQLTIVPLLSVFDLRNVFFGIEALSLENIGTTLLYFIYFTLMTFFFKQTVGKMILGISVSSSTGEKLTFGQAFYRETVGRIISNFLLYLPYLAVLFTNAKIGLHDFIADTYVVNDKYSKYSRRIKDEMSADTKSNLRETSSIDHTAERNF